MIKCEVTLCGIVSRVATRRTTKDGKAYTNFAVKVNIPERNGTGITAEGKYQTIACQRMACGG